MQVELKQCFTDPLLSVMTFLSEVTREFPNAISFATGSPAESFFDVGGTIDAMGDFVSQQAAAKQIPEERELRDLGQYNRTAGIISSFILQHLARDEHIQVPQEAVLVTSGCQEAMAIIMMGLFDAANDVLLASDPTYIGITGVARLLGISTIPVPSGEVGLEPEAVQYAINEARSLGKRPRALYDIPDFNNPLGTYMPLETRHRLIETAYENDLLIVEDNPYGMFAYNGSRLPTLKALDKRGVVLYMGTFSKTLFPGLRTGFLVADQKVRGSDRLLAEELSKVKSFITVSTSALLQAAIAGVLIRTGGSLASIVGSKLPHYRANRDQMIASLNEEFGGEEFRGLIHWNTPAGGFFLTLTLPFEFDEQCFKTCVSEYGVLCCPMSFFSLSNDRRNQLRLSFSYVTQDQIRIGIARLAQFVRDSLSTRQPTPRPAVNR